jgi:hypothetical protein
MNIIDYTGLRKVLVQKNEEMVATMTNLKRSKGSGEKAALVM